ncbi:hypothetical protein [Candidatus Poriferisocius sp.]|uniref:hypothetical protein n=1 Tax=Candidatus Poriferisocius sp. TaxID=3101276 RepID=UPI003B02042E
MARGGHHHRHAARLDRGGGRHGQRSWREMDIVTGMRLDWIVGVDGTVNAHGATVSTPHGPTTRLGP